jgi:hypothetical protein
LQQVGERSAVHKERLGRPRQHVNEAYVWDLEQDKNGGKKYIQL